MHEFCPDCGLPFDEPRDLARLWLRFYQCPGYCGYFLHVADGRWIYPLQRLELEVGVAMTNAPEKLIEEAVGKIQQIDHKTVSIVPFEHHILGIEVTSGKSKPGNHV